MLNKDYEIVFFGHRQLFNKDKVRQRLLDCVEQHILNGAKRFKIGTHGEFDNLALSVCCELRNKYKDIKITAVFTTLSFLTKKEDYSIADDYKRNNIETMVYPIEDEHYKNQIVVNNRLMVDDCDIVICYVDMKEYRSGAKRAVNYAKRQGKQIINLYKEEDRPFYGMTEEEKEAEYKRFMEELHNLNKQYKKK